MITALDHSLKTDAEAGLDLGELAGSLGFLLRMAQLEVFDTLRAEVGTLSLKPGEFSVLWLVSRYPSVRQGKVAKSLWIKQAHMTKLVRAMEKQGYLTREIPDDDRRSVLLKLTTHGQAVVDRHSADFFDNFFAENNNLTKHEINTLVGLLQKYTGIKGQKT